MLGWPVALRESCKPVRDNGGKCLDRVPKSAGDWGPSRLLEDSARARDLPGVLRAAEATSP